MMRTMVSAAALALVCSAAATTASAQTDPAAPQEAGSAFEVGEVVVTARRREESLQAVPVSVTVLTEEALQDRGVASIYDLQRVTPGLNIGAGASQGGRKSLNISIRGVRSLGVAVYSSEVVRQPASVADLLYDVGSLQVLKGPQGTLFGVNSTSGAVLIQPNQPVHDFEGSLEARMGSHDLYGVTGVVNLPLGDTAALRIASDFQDRGGYIEGPNQDYDNDRHYSGRAILLLEPNDAFKNTTTLEHYRYDSNGTPSTPTFIYSAAQGGSAANFYNGSTGLPTLQEVYDAETANGIWRTNVDNDGLGQELTSTNLVNTTEANLGELFGGALGDLTVRNIAAYTDYSFSEATDDDGMILDILHRQSKENETSFINEFQVLGDIGDGRINWVAGYYFQRTDYDRKLVTGQRFDLPGRSVTSTRDVATIRSTNAIYGQVSAKLIDKLTATVGLRQTYANRDGATSITANGACAIARTFTMANFTTCSLPLSLEESGLSYTVGLDYQVTPDVLVYGVTRRGFNAGDFNTGSPVVPTYGPEQLTDYEIGVKSSWQINDMYLRANIALFRNEYEDIQRSALGAVGTPPQPFIYTFNVASATINGVEASVLFRPVSQLTFDLGFTYIDAKYDAFPYSAPGAPVVIELSGNALAQAPEYTSTLAATYDFPVLQGIGEPSLTVSASYQSTIYLNDLNRDNEALSNRLDPYNAQEGYALVNANFTLNNVGGTGVDLDIYGTNLTDETYRSLAVNSGRSIGVGFALYGAPRSYGVRVSKRF